MGNTHWGLGIHLIFITIFSLSMLADKCLGARNITATCSKQERLALFKFKNSVKDNYGMLSSWVGEDCCKWESVTCDNATGSVVGLQLRGYAVGTFSDEEFGEDLDSAGNEMVGADYHLTGHVEVREDYYLVGDELNSSLEELRHLEYLDLSGNDFRESLIPDFIGSFERLSYLNLSNAGFSGLIPSHVGNLSSLKVLDVSNSYPQLMVDDMAWISGLSSLEHLNLNDVDLSGAQNVDRLLYIIPSLWKLRLSFCSLSNDHITPNLNSSTKLANITHLDLSNNDFQGPLPRFLQNMTSLAFLDLSGYNLSLVWNSGNMLNMIPSVSELHLSHCELQKINLSPTHLNFSRHSNIQHLGLSYNKIEGRFPSFLTNMSSLLSLDLSYNNLNSSIPVMPNLLKLDLSRNNFRGIEHLGIWRQCHLKELVASTTLQGDVMVGPSTNMSECSQYALERLNLGDNNLNGSIPESLGRLTNLRDLDLSVNELTGPIPDVLGKLRSLKVLDLSSNYLTGPIPNFQGQLTKLRLSNNRLNGSIPDSMGRSIALTELLLQSNSLTGPIPVSLGRLTSLQVLSVSSNLLNGTIPISFGKLSKLYFLDASNNSLQGVVSEAQFANQSALKYLNTAYNNKLTFNVSHGWIPPFQLRIAYLGSCKISDEFPTWFRTQQNLRELVLSNASISGPLPTWLRQMPIIRVLDLSHNKMTGNLTNLPSGDRLNGDGYQDGDILLLQNNLFTGSIPRSLCTRTDLSIIDLSSNRLIGNIPACLGNLKSATTILLSSNKLSGVIPNSLGLPSALSRLQLNDNNFSGEVPRAFGNLANLDVLDLGENEISGNIPEWIGNNLTQLSVLRLHKNNFGGKIPQSLCKLSNLHILDLAHNSLTGSIPHCFGELHGMMELPSSYANLESFNYNGNVMQVLKGVTLEYSKMWTLVSNMDLSSNKLVGDIPQELTALIGLLGLNLSHNDLNGVIPKGIGNMTSLFSIDLSANILTGTIPQSMATLNFLSHLNLSNNNLSGRIPTGNQLRTLTDPSMYAGNRDLCGVPLPKTCSNPENRPTITSKNEYEDDDDDDESMKLWVFLGVVSGFVTGVWGVIGVLMFKKQWRYKLFTFSEAAVEKIQVAAALRISKMKRGREVA
ncbi:putative non-specific serine/threonine protein kinase [Tanacetum coccineum]|uniref:Non-specific serine/threonine protein kinase n=1 Tax=Tanacetum coccineum TaxID=301880 RepID=A0ABQ5F3I4_9ASTR